MARHFWLALLLTLLADTVAQADVNAGGVLIVHANPTAVYTPGEIDWCSVSTLEICTDATTSLGSLPGELTPRIWWVAAAFRPGSSPRLSGVTFGVVYPPEIVVLDWGPCGDYEVPNSTWPASGEGTAVTWAMAQTSDVVDVYWFAGYNYYGATPEFCLHPHPTQGGYFANDSVAGDLDEIAAYGCLGFVTSGSLPCPAPLGACCRDDGSCDLLSETDCLAEDSTVWMGPEVPCDPDPCIPVPTLKSTWGTVKRAFRL